MKVAVIFVILLVVLLPLIGVYATGDGTLKGRLQTFISYGLSLVGLLLCVLTIILSVYTVTSDIEHRQIYTVITKPIRRFELLLGKLLGVILLNAALLVLFSAATYAIAFCMRGLSKAPGHELIEANNAFFTARKALSPWEDEDDVSREVYDDYRKLKDSGDIEQIFKGMSEKDIREELTNLRKLSRRSAGVSHRLHWIFYNVKPADANGSFFVKYKYEVSVTPPDSQVYSQWLIGDYRQYMYGTKIETPLYPFECKDPVRMFREIEVRADAVAKDGYLEVVFLNDPRNNTAVIFPLEDGLEVLYKADTFTANFIRAVLLVLFRLIFLACLGILASTFLSFPVAILLCIVLFFIASFSGFVIESFDLLSENVTAVYSYTLRWMIRLLPQFDKANPTKFLVPGELLSWAEVARVAGFMVCIKSFLLLIFALIIFSFREIARIVV